MKNNRAVIFFMVYTVLFVWVFGSALDFGESMRFRWLVDSFSIILLVVGSTYLWRWFRVRSPKY